MSATRGWRIEPHAAPLHAWRDQDLARVAERIEAVLRDWAGDWGLPPDAAIPVRCLSASRQPVSPEGWRRLGTGEDGAAWIGRSGGEGERMARAWFDAGCTSPVVAAVVQTCQEDALRRLASAVQLAVDGAQGATPPSCAWDRWSGAVLALLPWSGPLLLEVGPARRLAAHGGPAPASASRTAVEPVTRAMAAVPLGLRVCLQGCDLTLGELQGLQPGDVLRLRHPVDAPVEVSASTGSVLCGGWLARSRGRRAVELAPVAPHGALPG